MAEDRKEFNRALDKWERLRNTRAYSDPVEYGQTAIIVAATSVLDPSDERDEEIATYANEGVALHHWLIKQQIASFVIMQCQLDDIFDVLRAPDVSSIVLIGNGSLSSFLATDTECDTWINWRDIARETTHLKTGSFIQRHCGHLSEDRLNVPLGTFAMREHRSVRAAVGWVLPTVLEPDDEARIRTVHDEVRLNYDRVKALFPNKKDLHG